MLSPTTLANRGGEDEPNPYEYVRSRPRPPPPPPPPYFSQDWKPMLPEKPQPAGLEEHPPLPPPRGPSKSVDGAAISSIAACLSQSPASARRGSPAGSPFTTKGTWLPKPTQTKSPALPPRPSRTLSEGASHGMFFAPANTSNSPTSTGLLVDLSPSSSQTHLSGPNKRRTSTSTTDSSSTGVTPPMSPFHRHRQVPTLPQPPSRKLEYYEREHPKNAFKCLNLMRQKQHLCDVSLVVEEKEIHAHKVVLASCSSYFEAMFIGEFAEPDGLPVVIEEVDETSLIALVDFSYTSRINITHKNVYSLFEAADLLQFHGVRNACFRFFKNQMNKSNCIRTWLFAESQNCTELIEASLKYIECNFLDIVRGREFLLVEPETVLRIVNLEDLAITCEEQVYEAVMGWLNHDCTARLQYASKLLKCIRFPSMSREYLMHIVDHEPVIQEDPDCLQLLIDGLQSHVGSVRATLKNKLFKKGSSKSLPRAAAMAVETVVITRGAESIGLGIMGGSDRPTHVFRQGERPGVFVREVKAEGAAAKSGKIRTGDRILSINGSDVSNSTHDVAIRLLVTSRDPITMLVRHEPPPAGLKELTLVTKPGEGFGFSISGGVHGYSGNPFDVTDEGIFISQIIAGGSAEQDGRLTVGTRILQVNSVSVLGLTHEEALQVLQGVLDRITLLICNGYDPSQVPSEQESLISWGEEAEEEGKF